LGEEAEAEHPEVAICNVGSAKARMLLIFGPTNYPLAASVDKMAKAGCLVRQRQQLMQE
jgi:hypothetical protein